MAEPVLTTRGLTKRYGGTVAADHIDMTIEKGQIYGLVGRNGAGKTTLLSILTAQAPLNGGSVTYGGEPVWENPRALADICFSRELSPTLGSSQNTMKIRDYLEAAALFFPRWDAAYAARLLAEFGLERKKKICKLSKGMMSMVTIVIALASRAPFTILDEPVAGLDVVARERFYQLLLEDYTETGRTFVVSTHIIEEAASVFEEVIFLDDGKVLEKAPTDELLAQFHTVSGLADVVDAACAGLQVLGCEQLGRQKQCVVRCGAGALQRAVQGRDVDVAPMSLQKVFVTLCGHTEKGAL